MDENSEKFEIVDLNELSQDELSELKTELMSKLGENDDDLKEIIEELIQEGSIRMKTIPMLRHVMSE